MRSPTNRTTLTMFSGPFCILRWRKSIWNPQIRDISRGGGEVTVRVEHRKMLPVVPDDDKDHPAAVIFLFIKPP